MDTVQGVPQAPTSTAWFSSAAAARNALAGASYIADQGLATAVCLTLAMGRPLLLEGPAGVGKTELAKALAWWRGVDLIRLQCYEGLDAAQALYEWDYARQLLYARLYAGTVEGEASPEQVARLAGRLYTEDFLLERPLLKAVRAGSSGVLLIDEIDRADDEFEAFLLEVLADFSVSIPELGTIRAQTPPAVIITSNRTRELHDALKRRCLFHWMDYPPPEREAEIVALRVPDIDAGLARAVALAVARIRELDLVKQPGLAETVDWARALVLLGAGSLHDGSVRDSLGWIAKTKQDLAHVRDVLETVLD